MAAGSLFYGNLYEQCERKFGISKIILSNDKQGVVADWSIPSEWYNLKTMSWQISHIETPFLTQNGVSRELIYIKKGKESIRIKIVVSSTGNRTTLNRFVTEMTFINSMVIPYNKADGLGDIYANLIYPDSRSLVWIYDNILFKIEHENIDKAKSPPLDTFALAKWMQNYAEKHVVRNIPDHYPKIARFDISPSKVHVGDTFHVSVIPAGEKGIKEFLLELDMDRDEHLQSWGEENNIYEFKALKPGPAKLTFTIIDRKTLLSSQKTVIVDVQEKGQ
jgi:hypothetical protein